MVTLTSAWGLKALVAAAAVFLALLLGALFRTNRIEVRWRQDGWAMSISVALRVSRFRIILFHKQVADLLAGVRPTTGASPEAGDPADSSGDAQGRPAKRSDREAGKNPFLPRSGLDALRLANRTIRTVERLEFDARIGLGDAMLSSLFVGACWSVAGTLLALLETQVVFASHPRIYLTPLYNEPAVAVRAVCIFHIRLGDIVWESVRRVWTDRSGKEGSPIGKPAASH